MKQRDDDLMNSLNETQQFQNSHKQSIDDSLMEELEPENKPKPFLTAHNPFNNGYDSDEEFFSSFNKGNSLFSNNRHMSKQLQNLAAIDCFATLENLNPYQKTYQDHLDVNNLVEYFGENNQYHIDKLFAQSDKNSINPQNKIRAINQQNQQMPTQKSPQPIGGLNIIWDNCVQDIDRNNDLSRLFEDPEEKMRQIKQNIAQSQKKKRARLNSGSSDQSKKRDSNRSQLQQIKEEQLQNKDLLKLFNKTINKQDISLDQIQAKLDNPFIHQQVLIAFEESKKMIRMEEPSRILTRFALDFVSILFQNQEFKKESIISNVNQQLEKLQMINKTMSDQLSGSDFIEQQQKSLSSTQMSKKRYKQWSNDEEQALLDFLNTKQRDIQDLSQQDWAEISQKLSLCQSQIYWKAKRLQKQKAKTTLQQQSQTQNQQSFDLKTSRKDMIEKALMNLPSQRGTKQEIFRQIETVYNIELQSKSSSVYKTLEQSLSKHFSKTPQEYSLNTTIDLNACLKEKVNNHSNCMKVMLIKSMLELKNQRGDIKTIKQVMLNKFRDNLFSEYNPVKPDSNLQQWEKSLLKIISRYKNIFLTQKAVYAIPTTNQRITENEFSQVILNQKSDDEQDQDVDDCNYAQGDQAAQGTSMQTIINSKYLVNQN